MHSDESWLSGLTRSMLNNGLDSTETFFDLMPRYPHAVKTLYHIVQMGFIKVFGYNLFAFRLISLVAGAAALMLFYKILVKVLNKKSLAIWGTVAVSLCIQFIYASHFARQEMVILAGMLGAIYYILKHTDSWTWNKDIVVAIITGIFAGVHPNSFLIALAAGSLYIYFIAVKKFKFRNLLIYITVTGLTAGIFVGISYIFDPNFISNYLKYGSGLGVQNTLSAKYDGLFYYYEKLFKGISVTYYTPMIKGELIAFAVAVIVSLVMLIWNRKYLKVLLPLAAINIGFMLIGRYSQPGLIFIFPFCFILVFMILEKIQIRRNWIIGIVIGAALLINSIAGVLPYLNNDYKAYLDGVKAGIPNDSKVLVNLNAEYAFGPGQVYDYRNLAYLDHSGMTFSEYISTRDIEYIIYPEEMDFIYKRRPVWNVVYGNLYPYYEDMQTFLMENCIEMKSFTSPYAMRIVQFANDKEWEVKIYRVLNDE
jgi:4-amino-4-deoxy-L-arabinose transferase-like glycosyltransferase